MDWPSKFHAVAFLVLPALLASAGCVHEHRHDRYRDEALRARCGKIIDRIENDRDKIAEIEPGRHEKAKQWYLDDIANAERDLDRCRAGY